MLTNKQTSELMNVKGLENCKKNLELSMNKNATSQLGQIE